MLHEQLFISCHLRKSFHFGFCILSQNGSSCHIVNISCHILGNFLACESSHRLILICLIYYCSSHAFLKPSMCFLCYLHFHPSGPGIYLFTSDFIVFLTAVNSCMISIIISSLLKPLINCSFGLLSLSLYSHLFASILRQPIILQHSHFALLLTYSIAKIIFVSLCRGLHFSLSVSKSPMMDLHFSYSSLFNVCINCYPSSWKQSSTTGTFLLPCML